MRLEGVAKADRAVRASARGEVQHRYNSVRHSTTTRVTEEVTMETRFINRRQTIHLPPNREAGERIRLHH